MKVARIGGNLERVRSGKERRRNGLMLERRARGGEADVKVTFNTSEKRRRAARLDDCDRRPVRPNA